MFRIEEVRDPDGLDLLARDWDELVDSGGAPSVFLTREWLGPWWRHLAGGRELLLLAARREGRLRALVPLSVLERRARGARVRVLQALGAGLSDRLGVLAAGDAPEQARALAALAAHLRRRAGLWDVLELRDQALEAAPNRAWAEALRAQGLAAALRPESRCPYLAVREAADVEGEPGLEPDWETFYRAHTSPSSRRNLNWKRNKLARLGELRIRFVGDVEREPEALEAIFGLVERDTSGDRERRRPFDDERGRRFFRDVSRGMSRRGRLDLALLEVGGRLLAYRYGLRFRDVYVDYFTGFAAEHAGLSPGTVLWVEVMKRAFAEGLAGIDLLRGDHPWKAQWTRGFHWNAALEVANPALRSRVARAVHGAVRRLGR